MSAEAWTRSDPVSLGRLGGGPMATRLNGRGAHGRRRHDRLGPGRGAVDVLTLHLASIVLGAGTPLFTGGAPRILVQRSVIATSTTKHLI